LNARVAGELKVTGSDIKIGPAPSGAGFRLEAVQFLPQPRDQVFPLFADAFQLEKLSPEWLGFSVLTPAPIRIKAGTIIDYRLKLHGIPIRWQSLISWWEPPMRFIDRQMRGPYRRWHHEHVFEPCDGGTLCRDIVDYEVIGGRLIHTLFVRPDLLKIFKFRHERLRAMFPVSNA
jgi:ligand-binding SRPBCC domain-containing protein